MHRDDAADTFQNICVVGLGNHARTKLLPAIVANGQQIAGVVTSQSREDFPAAKTFLRLEDALVVLPPDTLYVIATPPGLHFEQTMAVVQHDRDVLVEKPAFETREQAVRAFAASEHRQTVLAEAFMNRHTQLYRDALSRWETDAKAVAKIEIVFVIPVMPAGTFRSDRSIVSSSLYDMGCYGLALLADAGLPLESMILTEVCFAGDDRREQLHLTGTLNRTPVSMRIGVAPDYINSLTFRLQDESSFTYAPFFYGRPGDRVIERSDRGVTSRQILCEENAFEIMLRIPRSVWRETQKARALRAANVAGALQRLGIDLSNARAQASKS